MTRSLLSLAVLLLAAALAQAQESPIQAAYTKQEASIPMRDGKKLFTAIYAPKDASRPWPILLTRTPYSVSPYGPDKYKTALGPSPLFSKDGFIFVYQDVRGRNMSEGEFVNVTPHRPGKGKPEDIDESTDTYDTIEWIVKNVPNHNGRVGMWGISYPGFYTAAGMIDAHPALKACSPQAPVSDWFVGDDFHHNGAFYLTHAFRFFDGFGRPRSGPSVPAPRPRANLSNAYEYFLELGTLADMETKYFKGDVAFWSEMMRHPNYDDYWKARNIRTHLKKIRPAVLTVGGWFDAEDLFGALKVYEAVEQQSPGASNAIVMGPWYHGQWSQGDGESLGNVKFGGKTSVHYREQIEFPFFCHYLKDKEDPKLAEATMFETGSNQWRNFDEWPPKRATKKALYFHAGGLLSFEPPTLKDAAFDEYVSDPAKPVPYISGQATGMTREHMVDDQRFAATRPDVLVYRTEPLAEDLTLAGSVVPSLRVSTTGTDSDWVVKLIDVYPDNFPDLTPPVAGVKMGGYQQLLRGECFRGRFRNGFEKPEPFEPSKVEKVEYVMPDVLHTFKKGHRVMVQVQSSWFPLVDRNPQKFVDIYHATEADFQKATQRVYRSLESPSSVQVHVLN
ncbi:MAG TPA: CocE/NonD family hydrolase [Planctomycetota bacterium]|nr:CocE/NonD family hydrolase [Planctomycetota bacterium]